MTGKELGIAVAKEVMGWNQYSSDRRWVYPLFSVSSDGLMVADSEESTLARLWTPWCDMNDAVEVLRMIAQAKFSIRERFIKALEEVLPLAEDGKDVIAFTWWWFFYADQPRYILRAALEAVRGEQT